MQELNKNNITLDADLLNEILMRPSEKEIHDRFAKDAEEVNENGCTGSCASGKCKNCSTRR